MSPSVPSPQGPPPQGPPPTGLPNFGTEPLGPDEPELFAGAMKRILDFLGTADWPHPSATTG